MEAYFAAPIWNDDVKKHRCPHTAPKARTVDSIPIKSMTVIDAPHVTYRGAHFGGTFVVAKPDALPTSNQGWHKVEVYCLWFGHRLKTRGLMFKVDMAKTRVRTGVNCDVVFNLGS